jgi:MFS family permease
MEQSCYKCGQLVEEGRPFCPHCAAPQIRVLIPEPVAAAAPYAETDGIPQSPRDLPASETVPVLALPMSWSDALKPCALAALVATILMSLSLNALVAMLIAGFLAVVFYRQQRPGIEIKPANGARLGAMSGLLWFAMVAILLTVGVLVLHKGPEVQKFFRDGIDQAVLRTSDPQAVEMANWFKTAQGLQMFMFLVIFIGFIAAIVLGAIGGALGGTIFKRRNKS